VFESLDAVVRLALDDLRARRVIPGDVAVPTDGIIAERLAEVRAEEPSNAQPAQIIAGEMPRTPSLMMEAVSPTPAAGIETRAIPAARAANPPAQPVPVAHTQNPVPKAVPTSGYTAAGSDGPARAPAPVAREAASTARAAGPSPAARRASSFAPLFEPEDQEMVRTIEEALGETILPRAVLLLEALLVRVLERAGRVLGRAEAPPEAVAWSLSLPPERYARLRATAQRARRGGEVSRRDALEAYLVVATAQAAVNDLAR
jgi:hypothetical protein